MLLVQGGFFMNMNALKKQCHSIRQAFQYGILLSTGLFCTSVYPAVFTLGLTADIFSGTITNSTDVDGNVGKVWRSAPLSFSPITIDQGDQLTLNVQFLADQSIEMISGAWFSGNEEIDFIAGPIAGISVAGSSTLNSFSGFSGSLIVTLPVSTSFSTSGQLAGTITRNLTDTAFSFQGFSLDTTYTTLTGGPVTISSLDLAVAASDIGLNDTVVPVPAALWLFGSGLIGLIAVARRSQA